MVGENEKKATRNMMKSKLLQIVLKYLSVVAFYSTNKWNFACLQCCRAKKESNRIRKKDSTKQLIFPSYFFFSPPVLFPVFLSRLLFMLFLLFSCSQPQMAFCLLLDKSYSHQFVLHTDPYLTVHFILLIQKKILHTLAKRMSIQFNLLWHTCRILFGFKCICIAKLSLFLFGRLCQCLYKSRKNNSLSHSLPVCSFSHPFGPFINIQQFPISFPITRSK